MEEKSRKTPKEYGIKLLDECNETIDFKELGELVKLTYMNDKVNPQYICEILEKEKIPFYQRGLCCELGLFTEIIVQDKVIDYLIKEYCMEKDGSRFVNKLLKKEIK